MHGAQQKLNFRYALEILCLDDRGAIAIDHMILPRTSLGHGNLALNVRLERSVLLYKRISKMPN